MPLRLLCDEDLPEAVVRSLQEWGMDALRVPPGAADRHIAQLARREGRVLVTCDSDFANIPAYPPGELAGIGRVKIDPPFGSLVIAALRRMFDAFPTHELIRGKLAIAEASLFRVWDEPPSP